MARLGQAHYALTGNVHFFRSALAKELSAGPKAPLAAAIQLQGTAALTDGSARANRVQVLGVGAGFWQLGLEAPTFSPPGPEQAVINAALAEQLRLKVGDTLVVRVDKPSGLSREAAITPQEDFALALRVTVHAIAPDNQMGRLACSPTRWRPSTPFWTRTGWAAG